MALSRLIAAFGFTPTIYESAEAFISDPEKRRFSCVVTDYKMPGKSGVDLVEHLRADSFEIPIVLLTAADHKAVKDKCEQLQIALLKKPLDTSVLLNAIRDALSSPGGHQH